MTIKINFDGYFFKIISVLGGQLSNTERPVPSCKDPGGVSNGTRTGRSFKHHDTVNYECYPGYRLVGSRIRICLISGTWSGIPPKYHGKFSTSL